MYWDELVKRWRREAGTRDSRQLQAIGGNVAAFAARQPRRQSWRWLALIVYAALIALALLLLAPHEARALPHP